MTQAWSRAETALLHQYVERGLNAEEISQQFAKDGLSRTHQAVRRYIQRQRKLDPIGWLARVDKSPVAMPAAPLEAEGDCLVIGDTHCPYQDSEWINRIMALARIYGIRQVALIGDLIDWTSFSAFGRRPGVEAEDEIRAAEQLVRALASNFENVYYIQGNHEERARRATNHALPLERLDSWFITRPNVRVSRKKWMLLHSGGETFRLNHPRNYNRTPAANALRLCSKYLCHIISGHDHIVGAGRDVSGNFWGVDTGMCASAKLMPYIEEEDSNNPQPVRGACLVIGNTPIILTPETIAVYETLTRAKAA